MKEKARVEKQATAPLPPSGPAMMPGGDKGAYAHLQPIVEKASAGAAGPCRLLAALFPPPPEPAPNPAEALPPSPPLPPVGCSADR